MASLDDILTTAKNIVSSVNNLGQSYLNVQGAQSLTNISTATLVKSGNGRLASVVVLTAGSTEGTAYDSTSTTSAISPLCRIPNTVGVTFVNIPFGLGLVVAPGTGQVVTVSYS
jgi:hypothetical protein